MRTNLIVLKLDNGFNGTIVMSWDKGVLAKGTAIFNRALHPIAKGDYAVLDVNISATGKRMVKSLRKCELKEAVDWLRKLKASGSSYHWADEMMEKALLYLDSKAAEAAKLEEEEAARKAAEEARLIQASIELKEKEMESLATAPKNSLSGYHVDLEARSVFNTAVNMSQANPGKAVKVMMVGPSGYGKTTLPKLVAQLTNKNFLRMNCAMVRDPEEWFGYREAKEGSTVFIRSEFAKEIEKGNLVVVLDEFNRLEPWLHNTLFPLLDDDGYTVVHDEYFQIGEGVIVVATINSGYKYTGTFELDEALFNRFDLTLEVGPLPHREEVRVLVERNGGLHPKDADRVVTMANTLREHEVVCSTRTTLRIASMLLAGMDIRSAFEGAVIRRIPQDSGGSGLRKQVIDMVNSALGVYEPKVSGNDIFSLISELPQAEEKKEEVVSAKTQPVRISISHDKGRELLFVQVIKWIRDTPQVSPDADGRGHISLSVAHKMAEAIKKGEKVEIQTLHPVSDLSALVETLKGLGLTGVISAIK